MDRETNTLPALLSPSPGPSCLRAARYQATAPGPEEQWGRRLKSWSPCVPRTFLSQWVPALFSEAPVRGTGQRAPSVKEGQGGGRAQSLHQTRLRSRPSSKDASVRVRASDTGPQLEEFPVLHSLLMCNTELESCLLQAWKRLLFFSFFLFFFLIKYSLFFGPCLIVLGSWT